MNDYTDRIAAGTDAGRPRRFALGLLAYLVLAVLVFLLMQRYFLRYVAPLYGYDIRNVFVQNALFFVLLAAATLAALGALRWAPFPYRHRGRLELGPLPLSVEGRLRSAFLAGTSLSAAIAMYQARHGPDKLVSFLVVGALGAFAASLLATRREFSLVEVVARPSAALVAEVERAHAGIGVPGTPWDGAKRVTELVVSVAGMAVLLPISIPLAMAIWFQDPGPLLVAKVAVMRAGRSFNQLKLRSMVKDAEGATGPVPAAPHDARVTGLGTLLRRTHIDELPQMINIARGEMSFVGPRPERTVFVHRHLATVPGYAARHAVRPGLAQVYGDYYSTPAQKLRYDLLYIRRRGVALDVRLFASAVLIALLGIHPGGRRRAHRLRRRYQHQRWRAAYAALRGEPAPDAKMVEDRHVSP